MNMSNFWLLISVIRDGKKAVLPSTYGEGIMHTSHLVKYKAVIFPSFIYFMFSSVGKETQKLFSSVGKETQKKVNTAYKAIINSFVCNCCVFK